MSDLARNPKYPAKGMSGLRVRVHAEPCLFARRAAVHSDVEISEMQDEMDWSDGFAEESDQ